MTSIEEGDLFAHDLSIYMFYFTEPACKCPAAPHYHSCWARTGSFEHLYLQTKSFSLPFKSLYRHTDSYLRTK